MKKLLVLFAILLPFSPAFSQIFTMGPKAGINYSKVVFDETFTSNGVDFTYATQNAKVGVVAGFFARLKIASFSVQPEILFSQERSSILVSSISAEELQTFKVSKMDIPILAGFHLLKVARLQLGPVMTKIIDASVESPLQSITSVLNPNYDEWTWGYQVGIGFDIKRVTLDIRYEGNLAKLGMGIEVDNQKFNFDHRKNVVQVTLGYKIFGKK
jgi:hypothetical protein